ncbi:MAG: sigma factor, partial [Hyphomicrobiales bacterium]
MAFNKRFNLKYIQMFSNKKTKSQVTDGLQAIYPRLWRYCLVLTGSKHQADDLAQMTALRALEKAHQFKADTHLDRWI